MAPTMRAKKTRGRRRFQTMDSWAEDQLGSKLKKGRWFKMIFQVR
ncbi:hypothetical protein HMPREF0322_02700 [Desulfitobacterium hafniense DP7]|uniref:Uncharacterized protein n=1 Tax=Desulfitobacterium hafniense DP7 TaxID=537010 RepID=G9XP04_DESHA|nr:hypothetical protein HMPREF0322_02700 [Desulfitobacterium hafniense DP7]